MDLRDPQRLHQPHHDLFKVRTVLHLIDVPGVLSRAETALSLSREYFQGLDNNLGADFVEDAIGSCHPLPLASLHC